MLTNITKKNIDSGKASIFYRAFVLFPGGMLLDKWRESQALALEDIKILEASDKLRYEELLAEILARTDSASWALYIGRKYLEDLETK